MVGRVLAHLTSLLVLDFSVKVVRHKSLVFFCGRLWKRSLGRKRPGLEKGPSSVFLSNLKTSSVSQPRLPDVANCHVFIDLPQFSCPEPPVACFARSTDLLDPGP
jgi:hypothetical protein